MSLSPIRVCEPSLPWDTLPGLTGASREASEAPSPNPPVGRGRSCPEVPSAFVICYWTPRGNCITSRIVVGMHRGFSRKRLQAALRLHAAGHVVPLCFSLHLLRPSAFLRTRRLLSSEFGFYVGVWQSLCNRGARTSTEGGCPLRGSTGGSRPGLVSPAPSSSRYTPFLPTWAIVLWHLATHLEAVYVRGMLKRPPRFRSDLSNVADQFRNSLPIPEPVHLFKKSFGRQRVLLYIYWRDSTWCMTSVLCPQVYIIPWHRARGWHGNFQHSSCSRSALL